MAFFDLSRNDKVQVERIVDWLKLTFAPQLFIIIIVIFLKKNGSENGVVSQEQILEEQPLTPKAEPSGTLWHGRSVA